MPDLGQRMLLPLLVFFVVLTLATPAVAQFVAPPPAAPILPPNAARSPGTQSAPLVGQHCATQAGTCILNAPTPLGNRCSCVTPGGPAYGQTVR
jgi:hypothetical protein